jgi:cobalt-zinc-cadmium resistance protein CzcA
MEKIVNFSIKYKLIIILITVTIAGFGIFAILNIPVGAVPDITNNQVQVITTSGNLSTQEIEQFITAPVELEMANLPGVIEIRSVSKFGLSVVTIVFDEKLGTYLPRQLIAEKIKTASEKIPEGFGKPEMGPVTTGLGEIYQYILDVKPGYEHRYSASDMRTIQDWIVKRQLSGIHGVVEINSWGGFLKQYEVAVDPQKLAALNITLSEVFTALENNNSITGAAYIEKTGQSYFIRGDGQMKSLSDIENTVVSHKGMMPVLVKDIAKVSFGHANRYGAITGNGQGEKVMGQIMMLKNANSKTVIHDVKQRVEEVQKSLPEGVFINPVIERGELIAKTTLTVVENILIGCIIVTIVVFLLLGNIRSSLVIASMIPLALLFTLSMMYIFKVDANLMSLGALDFGIIIDGAVIIIEYIAAKITVSKTSLLNAESGKRQALIDKISVDGASKMMRSAVFGQIIILIVFIPILSLTGVEGKMFRPMALTFSFAILGAMFFGFTWLPVAASLFLKPEKQESKSFAEKFIDFLQRMYVPSLKWACGHKKAVLGMALGSFILILILFSRMGGEFVPTLDEGDFVIQPVLKTGTSLSQTVVTTTKMEKLLLENYPDEVQQVVSRIGAAEVPTDPMSMEEIDMIIKLKPRENWKKAKDKEQLADMFKETLSVLPGIDYEFTQPIEMRFNELITGVRADIAIKLYGEDLNYLNDKAGEIKSAIENVPGAADVILEKTAGLPQMNVAYNKHKTAYYGADMANLNQYLSMAFGGAAAGVIFEGEKRFDLTVRLPENLRVDINSIKNLMVPVNNGIQVPLSELAAINYTTGPSKISRDNTHRRVVVSVNVRNRDLKSVVMDIQKIVNEKIQLEPGYFIAYGGQFENLQNATNRLMFAVPIAMALIFIFLHFAFKSVKDALLIYSAVPLATVGGVLLLWIRGMPFSVSAGIGFIALFGIAVLNGIVLVEHLKELKHRNNVSMHDLIIQGSTSRLRPVLLTASAAALGFLPMAISNGAGAEVQRPLATVVIGGLITSTLLTLIALPLLFEIFYNVTGFNFKTFRFIRKNTFVILAGILMFSSFRVTASEKINLENAIQIALKNNLELKNCSLKIKQMKVLETSAFNVGKTELNYGYDQNNIAENGYPLKVLGVNQQFSFPTLYVAQYKALKAETEIAVAEFEYQKFLLIKDITQAVNRINYLQNKLSLMAKTDSLYTKIQSTYELKQNKGSISRLDLLNMTARSQQIRNMLNAVSSELASANNDFNALLQSDTVYTLAVSEFNQFVINFQPIHQHPFIKILETDLKYRNAVRKVENHKLLPDLSLSYFNGTNEFTGAKNYHGYSVGVAIPLFFGENKAKIKAAKISSEISQNLIENELMMLENKKNQHLNELKKYENFILSYNKTGRKLADEIFNTSTMSYNAGEISFLEYALSIENALNIQIEYLDNLFYHNRLAIDLSYLTH